MGDHREQPLNTAVLEKMFSDPEDLGLVWPVAH